jgi:hypothetical protein
MGSGAVIQLVPDAPLSLTNDVAVSSASQIKFTWTAGSSDGGASVIDYWIEYDQASDNWTGLVGSLVNIFSYTTTITLT